MAIDVPHNIYDILRHPSGHSSFRSISPLNNYHHWFFLPTISTMNYKYHIYRSFCLIPIAAPKNRWFPRVLFLPMAIHGSASRPREGHDGKENHHDTEQALHQIRGFDDVRAHAYMKAREGPMENRGRCCGNYDVCVYTYVYIYIHMDIYIYGHIHMYICLKMVVAVITMMIIVIVIVCMANNMLGCVYTHRMNFKSGQMSRIQRLSKGYLWFGAEFSSLWWIRDFWVKS